MAEESKPRKLGRGLSALFGEESESDAEAARKPSRTVAIGQIHPGRYQPRRVFDDEKLAGLVDSIRDKGILSPLLVRVHPTIQNAYELIAGERRWRAAQKAQLHDVPVIVRDLTDRETLEIALVENLQCEDLNALEEAEEFGHTQDELAKAVGKSRSHVANTMRLLGLGEKVRGLLTEGKLSAGHARALLGVERAETLADEIVERGLNVRQVEALVQQGRKPGSGKSAHGREPDADTLALERELTGSLGLAVKIRIEGSGGEVVISYRTLDQLDHLLKRLR
jgi:ParB family transcriptional regulator, chromosome partitioning protein